jgi:hypothetical protein
MSGKKQTYCRKGLHELTLENTIVSKGNRRRVCKICSHKWWKQWHQQNKVARNKKSTEHRQIHKEQCNYNSRKYALKRNGWSPETITKAKKKQHNRCAICKCKFTERSKAHADHKHITPPKPRGILCRTCNWGLGMFYDKPSLLRKAAEYLEKFN